MATPAKAPSFSAAAEAANLPKRIKMDALAALGVVTYHSATPSTARLPGTGDSTDGFVVVVEDSAGKLYQTFVGAQILVDTLARINFPFRARIVKQGQAWVFSD